MLPRMAGALPFPDEHLYDSLVRRREKVITHLGRRYPSDVVVIVKLYMPAEHDRANGYEVDDTVTVIVLYLGDRLARLDMKVHLLAKLARRAGSRSLARLYLSAGEFPVSPEGDLGLAPRDEYPAFAILDNGRRDVYHGISIRPNPLDCQKEAPGISLNAS